MFCRVRAAPEANSSTFLAPWGHLSCLLVRERKTGVVKLDSIQNYVKTNKGDKIPMSVHETKDLLGNSELVVYIWGRGRENKILFFFLQTAKLVELFFSTMFPNPTSSPDWLVSAENVKIFSSIRGNKGSERSTRFFFPLSAWRRNSAIWGLASLPTSNSDIFLNTFQLTEHFIISKTQNQTIDECYV